MPEAVKTEPSRVLGARSCWYYGCLTLGMMLLVTILSIYFGGRYFLKTFVHEYTSEKAEPLPKVPVTEEAWKDLQARLTAFRQTLEESKHDGVLDLSADDINALIQRDPALAEFKDHLYVRLEGEKATCQFSYLLERLGAEKILHGRYLNGEGELVPNMVDGQIYLTLLDVRINQRTVPDTVKPGLQAHNLAASFNTDPKAHAFLRRVRGISIQKDRLILVVHPAAVAAP